MFELTIVTPYGVTYQDTVQKVTIPTVTGQITILPGHIPLVSVIAPGEVVIGKGDHEVHLAISRGVLEMRDDDKLYLIADTAERAEEIDVERAERARARAAELLKQKDQLADVDFIRIQAQIEKELARLGVAKKWK